MEAPTILITSTIVIIVSAVKDSRAVDLVLDALRAHLPPFDAVEGGRATAPEVELRFRDRRRAWLEVKAVAAIRRDDILGRLSLEVLTLRRLRASDHATPIAAIVVPYSTRSAVTETQNFMRDYAPEFGWVIVGRDRSVHIEIPQWNVTIVEGFKPRRRRVAEPEAIPLFRDLHQWLLKVVLLRDVPPPLWFGPRGEIESTSALAARANVSIQTASRFVRTFTAKDFLRVTDDGISSVRRGELIRAWVAHAQRTSPRGVPVRSIYGSRARIDAVLSQSKLDWALSGFAACEELGILHATYGLAEAYVAAPLETILRLCELSIAETRNAHFVVIPGHEESIFRALSRDVRTPTVDVLQAALDVSAHAARGAEQAHYILHEVLGWRDA